MKCIWIIDPMKSCLVSQRLGTTVLNIFFRWNVFFLWLNTLILSQLWRPMVNESFYCPLCISVVFLPESILHCFRYVNEVFFFFFFFPFNKAGSSLLNTQTSLKETTWGHTHSERSLSHRHAYCMNSLLKIRQNVWGDAFWDEQI